MYPLKMNSVVMPIRMACDMLKATERNSGDGLDVKPNRNPGINITMM